jgi:hypothetical protein
LNTDEGWLSIPGYSRYSYHPERHIMRRDAVKDAQGRVLRKPFVLKQDTSYRGHWKGANGKLVYGKVRLRSKGGITYYLIADGKKRGDKGYGLRLTVKKVHELLGLEWLGKRPDSKPVREISTGRVWPSISAAATGLQIAYSCVTRRIKARELHLVQ